MKTETIAQLPIVKKDPWLEPNAGDMLRRYDRYRERLSAIGKIPARSSVIFTSATDGLSSSNGRKPRR